ncbi:hypothetical protein BD413DRAFT_609387 [Trametes elegans]|nr:hypothetical protein BD413DRAFT_609387 [Trametes elegans]
MVFFLWDFVLLVMSILIFVVGRLIPHARPKPPPIVLRPRSPRIQSEPASPILSPPKSILSEPEEEDTSCETSVSLPAHEPLPVPSPPSSTKRPSSKKKWSFPTRFFSARPGHSRNSSTLSERSATLVGSPSPPRFFPELPIIESDSSSVNPSFEQMPSRSEPSTPTRARSGVRLPGAKMFKSFSRKLSGKQKSEPALSRESSPRSSIHLPSSHEGSGEFGEKVDVLQHWRAATLDDSSRGTRPSHLLHERNRSYSGEVLTTSFVNPFRTKTKPRRPKTAPIVDLSEPSSPSPSPKRPTRRRMLTSFQLALASPAPFAAAAAARTTADARAESRRSSVSSTSTAVSALSAPSVLSSSSGAAGSPRGVPRTQPYAAPYFAAMPRSAAKADPHTLAQRRSSSLSSPRRPETVEEGVEEEPEDAGVDVDVVVAVDVHAGRGALGLSLGELGHGRAPWLRRQPRLRVAASEGAIPVVPVTGR